MIYLIKPIGLIGDKKRPSTRIQCYYDPTYDANPPAGRLLFVLPVHVYSFLPPSFLFMYLYLLQYRTVLRPDFHSVCRVHVHVHGKGDPILP